MDKYYLMVNNIVCIGETPVKKTDIIRILNDNKEKIEKLERILDKVSKSSAGKIVLSQIPEWRKYNGN